MLQPQSHGNGTRSSPLSPVGTFEVLDGSSVLSDAVLELTTGFLQMFLQLLVFLLQLSYSLGGLLHLGQRLYKWWTVWSWTLTSGLYVRVLTVNYVVRRQ